MKVGWGAEIKGWGGWDRGACCCWDKGEEKWL